MSHDHKHTRSLVRWALAITVAVGLAAAPSHTAKAAGGGLKDGGFEAGRNAGIWVEKSTNFGTPICSFASCGSGSNTAAPRNGSYWLWLGGAGSSVERGSVSQRVRFPSGGSAVLRFYLWIGAASDDGKDWTKVFIDGQRVFTVKETSTKYSSYKQVEIDVSQFADGARHKILFKNYCSGDDSTNFNIDDVTLTAN